MSDDPIPAGPGRRSFLVAAAVVAGAPFAGSLAAAGPATASPAGAVPTTVVPAAVTAVEPVYGAGVFDVDPSQTGVSQSPTTVVTSNVTALPLDLDF